MSQNKSKALNDAKSIFVANVKGGVGKSTLAIMLARSLASKIPPQNITVIDTDLQRTTTEFLTVSNPEINVEFLPITPAFENTNISLVQQFIKQNEFRPGHVVIVDTPAGSSQRLWNLVAEGYCVLIPTTLSNADLSPTENFIRSIDKVKARYGKSHPHLIVCPNKIPFGQKDFSIMAERLNNHDVVIGPPLRDLASVRHFYNGKAENWENKTNSNALSDFGQFGSFIEKFVLNGELDKIYSNRDTSQNIIPFGKVSN
ncbi:MAG: ParA family protein [Alphaproteobacteria bacterium]|jgi:chromosome partitioning protein|nr:ParA family protein [Alphaproteobacteria bacterium]